MTWPAMTTDDPWKDLAPPSSLDALSARRVDADLPWAFFWARCVDRNPMLLLRHAAEVSPEGRPPRLKGLEVTLSEAESDGCRVLALRLLDSAQRDIFHRLCLDIVSSASLAHAEAEAVALALARTWRWHHLLRGGTDGRLSLEEQKGLLGELHVLENVLLPHLQVIDAVTAWQGPLGAPKDFEVGRIAIEAKARRGAARPFVTVSSEHQLSTEGTDRLFLHVVELAQAPAGTPGTNSLTEVTRRLHDRLSTDGRVAELFEARLFAAGFSWDHDYSDTLFVAGPSRVYEVAEDFPSITPAMLSSGVSQVRYSISLPECDPFLVETDAIRIAIAGAANGD